jgi:hypothetical protein
MTPNSHCGEIDATWQGELGTIKGRVEAQAIE